ncbi:MAG TPA: FAD binding domain-containing protein [Opitutaceae bacterium]|nr:FAD binding domain-containing protein [Opitutaceae bacterium]
MKTFTYATARSPESAVELVRDRGRYIAGGIDLLGEMKDGLVAPGVLVNVKNIPGTSDIAREGDRWTIGANATLAALASHVALRESLPGLAEAAEEVGSPQMRNVATVGGNLAQHSRCWYYRHPDVECLKNGGKRCYARGGNTKYHSLFSGCMCLSPCTSNLAVMLSALEARIVVQRGAKSVTMPIAKLYDASWREARAQNSLEADDLILHVEVPVARGLRNTYLQMAEKSAFDWALVSCAAAARIKDGKLHGVRVALGCIAPIPWLVEEANEFLEGKVPSDENASRVADIILRDAETDAHNAYKVPLAYALIRRAITRLSA